MPMMEDRTSTSSYNDYPAHDHSRHWLRQESGDQWSVGSVDSARSSHQIHEPWVNIAISMMTELQMAD